MGIILNEDIGKRFGKVWFDFENRKSKKYYGRYFIAIQEPLQHKYNTNKNGVSVFCEAVERKILTGKTKSEIIGKLEMLIDDLIKVKDMISEVE